MVPAQFGRLVPSPLDSFSCIDKNSCQMDTSNDDSYYELPLVQILSDPKIAALALKTPRPAILAALRTPDSASGLARRLELSRQRLNYYLRELETAGLVQVVEERQRRGCTERLLLASAHTFLLSPDLLGDLGVVSPEGLDRYGWPFLAILAGRTLRDLAVLRETHGDEVPALNLPTRVRFSSSAAFQGFVDELSEEIGRLLAKYHDEIAPAADHWFFLGAYPLPDS